MPGISIQGKDKTYYFSVVEADFENMPEWGGIYLAVKATNLGLQMENCVAVGSCANFRKYAQNIQNFIADKNATHLYLLPEFEMTKRQFAMSDLMQTEAFQDVMMRSLEMESLQQEYEAKKENYAATKEQINNNN